MANSRSRSRTGDMFTLPVDEQRVAYGQIVHKTPGGLCWLAVFEGVGEVDREPEPDAIVASPLALLAKSFDVLIKHGQWQVIGHRQVDPTIPWPAFKVHTPSGWAVQDYTGERMRPASAEEIDQLPLDVTVAPIRVEHAARALCGQAPWSARDYDLLLPVPSTRTTAHVFSHEPPPAPPGHGDDVVETLLAQPVTSAPEPGTAHARFFLTVPNRRAWWRLRSALKQLGLNASAHRDPDGGWSVVADARAEPSAYVAQLASLAQSAGGTYDGHERALG